MTEPILKVTGLVKRFAGLTATDNLSLDVRTGEVHAIIGPNGAGKTTFISLLTGEQAPNEGSIVFAGQEITGLDVPTRARAGIGRSYQISQVFRELTALQNVALAVQATKAHSFSFFKRAADDAALTGPAMDALRLVGLEARAHAPVSSMAHGEHRQLELAMTLATRPQLLLLDEPMAGMSQIESGEMVALLKTVKGKHSILLVEHDMDAVFALADRVSVLVYGRVIATGTPDEIRNNADVKTAYLGDQEGGAV